MRMWITRVSRPDPGPVQSQANLVDRQLSRYTVKLQPHYFIIQIIFGITANGLVCVARWFYTSMHSEWEKKNGKNLCFANVTLNTLCILYTHAYTESYRMYKLWNVWCISTKILQNRMKREGKIGGWRKNSLGKYSHTTAAKKNKEPKKK